MSDPDLMEDDRARGRSEMRRCPKIEQSENKVLNLVQNYKLEQLEANTIIGHALKLKLCISRGDFDVDRPHCAPS